MKYYISDTHFGHANIMKHSERPFFSVEEMDKAIIDGWNKYVRPDDEVYFLGDFCYKSANHNPLYYLEKLNGIKYLIVGNHDRGLLKDPKIRAQFEWIRDIETITDGNNKIVLCHYPLVEWNGYFRGVLHFYGHIHNNVENQAYKIMKNISNAYNVGADILDFAPRTLSEVIEYNKRYNENIDAINEYRKSMNEEEMEM